MAETAAIRLLFPPHVAEQLKELSQKISGVVNSDWRLEGILPHVTLFSFAFDNRPIGLRPTSCAVSFTGLCPLGSKPGFVWIALGVQKTREIVALRESLLQDCGNPVPAHAGFIPHVTLGHILEQDFHIAAKSLENDVLLRIENILCSVDGVIHSPEKGHRPCSRK